MNLNVHPFFCAQLPNDEEDPVVFTMTQPAMIRSTAFTTQPNHNQTQNLCMYPIDRFFVNRPKNQITSTVTTILTDFILAIYKIFIVGLEKFKNCNR